MIEVYIIAWNEIDSIHFTINYYKKFCTRITVYDNYSDDGTYEKAKALGCTVKKFGQKGILDDQEYIDVKNNCWKNSTADWVIIIDSDEIIWHEQLSLVLDIAKNTGSTIFRTLGFNVYSNKMPILDYTELRTGVYDKEYSKLAVFSPNLKEIGYEHGCHYANPLGDVIFSEYILTLFHYRNIGGFERLSRRHAQYKARLSDFNIEQGFGNHYTVDEKRRLKQFNNGLEHSIDYDSSVRINQYFINDSNHYKEKFPICRVDPNDLK